MAATYQHLIFAHECTSLKPSGYLPKRISKLPVKGRRVNILGFASHMSSVKTTQFCHCKTKIAKNNIFLKHGYLPIKLFVGINMNNFYMPQNSIFVNHVNNFFFILNMKKKLAYELNINRQWAGFDTWPTVCQL